MNKKVLKTIFIEGVYFLIQLLFSKINVFGITPVGLPFAMCRICLGQNLLVVVTEYAVSRLFYLSSLKLIFVTVYHIVIISLYYFAKEFVKTKKQRFMLCVFVACSGVLSLYYGYTSIQNLILFFAGFFAEILLALFFHKFFTVLKSKFLFFKFSNLDYLVFSIMTLLTSMGLFSFGFVQKYIALFIISFLVIASCRVLPSDKYFLFSAMLGVGSVCATGDYLFLMFAIFSTIVLVNFKDVNKYVYAVIVGVCFTIFVPVFKFFTFISYFSLIFAVFLYIILPNKYILKLSALFDFDSLNILCEELQNAKIYEIKQKLQLMSDTFSQMQSNFKFLLVGKINREKACEELSQDIINKCCKNCENFRFCYMENINKKQFIESLLFKAVENKQIAKEDLNNGLQAYCMKHGIMVNEINQMARIYLSYENAMKTEDSSKLMIASELGNFSDIFSNFAKMIKYSLKINKNISKIVKEALLNNMLDAKEVVVLENDLGVESVNVIAENELVLKTEMLSVVQKIIRNRFKIKQIKHLELSGLSVATFIPSSKLRVDFAIATKAKEQKNGDSVVVSKLSENKYFLAIADGMGHGEKANKISSMVLSLIKSMFQVGFEDELVLQSVNKLLIPAGLDNFTTLDAVVIDLEKEVCNFIKLGSSVSIVKHRNTSEMITCSSLPMGIVQNIKPTIIKKNISYGDVIFLASDGVVDSFSNIENFKTFINDSKIYNLQKYVDAVMQDAESQNALHPDDMTIIAINLLKN